MGWNAKYALLIGSSTAITYVSGLLLDRADHTKEERAGKLQKKLVLAACMAVNLGILAVFKYGNFAINSVNYILSKIHVSAVERRFDLLLPVGISFYTFQALGYIMDVYRNDVEVEKNPVRYALFVSFFLSSWQDRSRDQKSIESDEIHRSDSGVGCEKSGIRWDFHGLGTLYEDGHCRPDRDSGGYGI